MAEKKRKIENDDIPSTRRSRTRRSGVTIMTEEHVQARKRNSRLTIDQPPREVTVEKQDPLYRLTCMNSGHRHVLSLSVVDSDDDRLETFRIRHTAYCGEGKPLPAQPDGLERDVYDESAIHIIARLDGVPIGTVRTTFVHNGRFVIETFEENGAPVIKIPAELPRHLTAEPSRLAMDKALIPTCVYSPLITVALHHRNYIAGVQAGLKYWVLEPNEKNLRVIRRLGWKMHSLGVFEHHGQRFEASWMPLEPSAFAWELND